MMDHLAWGKRELVCVLRVRLFVLYVLVFLSFFSSSWFRELVTVCGTPWTFLLPFFFPLNVRVVFMLDPSVSVSEEVGV